MAKSKILKELANNEIAIDVALKRLLIICNDLDYADIYKWAEKELNGYNSDDPVPEYRNLGMGQLKYCGLKGTMINHLKLTNQPLPIQWIPKQFFDLATIDYTRETILSIIEKAESKQQFIQDYTWMIPYINVGIGFTSITKYIDYTRYSEIVNKISSILLKIFIKLDKEYGNLDELDIDLSNKDKERIKEFEKTLKVEIGKINFVNIGDQNTINKSHIGDESE